MRFEGNADKENYQTTYLPLKAEITMAKGGTYS